jgi:hypothetical protein
MAANKRLQDLIDYTSVLPYASEIFGVYQPLIGWKSARKVNRIKQAVRVEKMALLSRLGQNLVSEAAIEFTNDHIMNAPGLMPARLAGPRLVKHDSVVLQQIGFLLKRGRKIPENVGDWNHVINEEILTNILRTEVLDYYNKLALQRHRQIEELSKEENESEAAFKLRKQLLVEECECQLRTAVEDEAVCAGVINLLLARNRINDLASIFYTNLDGKAEAAFDDVLKKTKPDFDDPYLTFDPKKDVKDVSLSPIGIVHLFREYFFELDTFLGTPISHIWLSPGAEVELIEISTRKIITEKTVEDELEMIVKTEKSTTNQDELSEAVKEDNRQDLKLGATVTVNQSWGSGNLQATASLDMNRTQQTARETTHKRMREQTEKLSSQIRQNYKTTFKQITEVTDVTSKRYKLSNVTQNLINYELRRKMRQVAVQVQDIGSYLCWETFVDEPGMDLGLANMIHIAQPPDLVSTPAQTDSEYPSDKVVTFRVNAEWTKTSGTINGPFIELTTMETPPAPEGSKVAVLKNDAIIPLKQVSVTGDEVDEYSSSFGSWNFGAKFASPGLLSIGVIADKLNWDDHLNFVLAGALTYTVTDEKKKQIDDAVKSKATAGEVATIENERKTKDAYIKAAKERIEFASDITRRAAEDLREEERIIVYRRLIESLMWSYNYKHADSRNRHVLSELINSIFDIDKMLYFVAPDWWKPREHKKQFLSINDLQSRLSDSIVGWGPPRDDNYLITEKSIPAPLGSSLGWLLQLDGDNLRNAFLNAPWVKAVIPVRPGKEQAAMAWLQNVNVEGSEGLGPQDFYAPSGTAAEVPKELDHIRTNLGLAADVQVTLRNAIDSLCIDVAKKHDESNTTKQFPDNPEISDDNKVTSTPVEKVFEYGFDPLKGGFRVIPNDKEQFEVFDQWIEVLPTDQVVPVEVKYDPKTGRLI